MKRGTVSRMALAGALALAAGAPARDIPVHREYTRPIQFDAETTDQDGGLGAPPDRYATQSLRDAKAQEGYLGKETLLEIAFPSGAPVLGPAASKLLPPAPVPSPDIRRDRGDSGANWLAKSLTLPTLGQKPENPATSALQAEGSDSSWGWLADEVASSQANLGPAVRPEERLNPVPDPEAARRDENPSWPSTAENPRRGDEEQTRTVPDSAGSMAGRPDWEPTAMDRPDGRGNAAERNQRLEASGPFPGSGTPDSRRDNSMAELSRTRAMLADLTAGARPDLSALRESSGLPPLRPADFAGADERQMSFGMERPGGEPRPAFGQANSPGGTKSLFPGGVPAQSSHWQGNWSASGARLDSPSAGWTTPDYSAGGLGEHAPAPSARPPVPIRRNPASVLP